MYIYNRPSIRYIYTRTDGQDKSYPYLWIGEEMSECRETDVRLRAVSGSVARPSIDGMLLLLLLLPQLHLLVMMMIIMMMKLMLPSVPDVCSYRCLHG